jgi:hypothetical protein
MKVAKCERGIVKWKINRMSKENKWNEYNTIQYNTIHCPEKGVNERRERENLKIKV